ncbi:uncharacterized protein LOC132196520 isoform X2 [Neocloeon triangulifer]|nr:uncharacterized protein LOC132196520 isoform X2 [Neocloeon triangulifer]
MGINAERLNEELLTVGLNTLELEHNHKHEDREKTGRCAEELEIPIDRFGDTVFYFQKRSKYFVELHWFPAVQICNTKSRSHSDEKAHDEKMHETVDQVEQSVFGSDEGNNTFFFTGMMDLSSSKMYALELNDENIFAPWPDKVGPDNELPSCPSSSGFVPKDKNCVSHREKILCGLLEVCGQ